MEREQIFIDQPQLLVVYGQLLFPVLVQVFNTNANSSIRHKCLAAITKVLHFQTPEMLADLLKDLSFSAFIASLLSQQELVVVLSAIHMAETLMHKLPKT